jgi:hypothetical protein
MLRTARRVPSRITLTRVREDPRTGPDFSTRNANAGVVARADGVGEGTGAGVSPTVVVGALAAGRGAVPFPPRDSTSPVTSPATTRAAASATSTPRGNRDGEGWPFEDKLFEA